ILARYLALVAQILPDCPGADAEASRTTRETARTLVLDSARSAWDHRQVVDGLPLFGPLWDRAAERPRAGGRGAQFVQGAVNASEIPERDLSVQLSGWMLMEAAHALTDETSTDETADEADEADEEENPA